MMTVTRIQSAVRKGARFGSRPELSPRARKWRAAACWSVIAFVSACGVAAISGIYVLTDWTTGTTRLGRPKGANVTPPPVEVAAAVNRRALDGRAVPDDYVEPGVYAVMVDNMVDARPPSGLNSAGVVFEAPAEGGITRFLAVFNADDEVKRIGPVRSARPYYIDLASGFGDIVYAHCGGSPEALEKLKTAPVHDFNEFYRGQYFWRDTGRAAPHNVYTSSENLLTAMSGIKGLERAAPASWKWKEEPSSEALPTEVKDIVVDYSTPAYRATWRYDRTKNDYRRLQGDTPALERDGREIRAKNVVIQFVDVKVLDAVGRRRIVTVGEGDAVTFRDGIAIVGRWSRATATERLRFFDTEGREIEFNSGLTWVQLAPIGADTEY